MRILHENRGEEKVIPLAELKTPIVVNIRAPEQIRTSKHSNILNTPPPYTQPWLDANGLRVLYKQGRAVLQFRK